MSATLVLRVVHGRQPLGDNSVSHQCSENCQPPVSKTFHFLSKTHAPETLSHNHQCLRPCLRQLDDMQCLMSRSLFYLFWPRPDMSETSSPNRTEPTWCLRTVWDRHVSDIQRTCLTCLHLNMSHYFHLDMSHLKWDILSWSRDIDVSHQDRVPN